ncbi:MAG: CDP-alcohol phosphatidyltransferase family protein [Polyangiaceae bacterium]|nr:CDP-alcohol phosphatidyltransferase family protein [Polyangiaceae bacterium]
MASGAPAYKVEDRSLLLPFYRRFLIDPFLPYLPRSLHPNTITHVGHLLNLAGVMLLVGLWPQGGWPYVAATILLQLYCWCDNADGAHARRTGQCSPLGEFLDHGLDMLNTAYIALLTAMALGAAPLGWVSFAVVIPGAAVAAYWEQAQTGVFRLGLLNQIESIVVLSTALMTSAIFGNRIFDQVALGPLTLGLAMTLWPVSTILFGVARGIVRVIAAQGLRGAVPVLGPLLLWTAVTAATALEVIPTAFAVIIALAGNVTMGMRMLSSRLLCRRPRLEPPIVVTAAVLFGLVALRLAGHGADPQVAGPALATVACAIFGLQSILDARDSVQELSRTEQAGVAVK